ncbi:hypothetical protein SAMN04488503_0790 [Humidesulfovibrio mexicanus]|uniref:PepSY domain-containing protein n=1 Tax=Humidesulfovibrio mexicanus TaxID=147047 RepID=A0A238Y9C7_9BACT|nr:hypothetical protein [Humidesulfovibrio mexicanus]SNR67562.1 hypothetical protein SAMN04488503_0790 [Humidesulfovibrio mexicanus]
MKKGFWALAALFAILAFAVSGQAAEQGGQKAKAASARKVKEGKPCKGFDPKTDVVVERDKAGNCVLYHRDPNSPGVSFVFDANGELWARSYGKNFE